MKISADILCTTLKMKEFQFKIHGELGCDLMLDRPLFIGGNTGLQDNRIYIAGSIFPIEQNLTKTNSVLLYVGPVPDGICELFQAVFEFEEGLSIFELHNCVQAIYSEHEAWDTELQDILNSGGGVQEMIDCSVRIFGNPIMLHNKNFVAIALSSNYSDDTSVLPMLDKDKLTEYTNAFKMDAEYQKTYSQKHASIFPAHITGTRSMYVNIYFQGSYEYRLVVTEAIREFYPSDGPQLEHLASYIRLAISAQNAFSKAEVITLHHVLKSILTGEYSDPYYIEQKLNEYHWQKQQEYLCMKVLADILDIHNHTLNFLCGRIQELIRGSCAFEYFNDIVVYVNLSIFGGDSDDAAAAITPFLRDSNLKIGISNAFTGFGELKLYYRQAEIALRTGLRSKPYIWIQHFRDVIEPFLLENCTEQLPARMVCAPEILFLKQYDEEHGTAYFHTLKIFLQNHLRHAPTSSMLYIHRSTLIYRLDRIRELTDIDFEDGERQWYLMLSYKLLETVGH